MKAEIVDFRRLSQRECGDAHGVDARTIRRWTDVGMPRWPDGTYDLPVTIRWRAAHTRNDGEIDVDGIRRGYY